MNHEKTLENLNNKINESIVSKLMTSFNEEVSKFPAAYIDVKNPKKEDRILKASNPVYKFHTKFNTPKNNYENSIILICNDLAVSHMVSEVAEFCAYLDLFMKETKNSGAIKNVQELNEYYKKFNLKSKDLLSALIKDLELYSERYNFDLDKREIDSLFKEKKKEFEFKILENLKEGTF